VLEHHPIAFAAELGAKLATRSRHVCVFIGAGVGRACGLPDVAGLQQLVLERMGVEDRAVLEVQLKERNLEELLSRLRRIAALISGDQTVDGLTADRAVELDRGVCRAIVEALDLDQSKLKPIQDFCAWAARARYRLPLELFTVNYDLLVETGLESKGVPYFDGFVGNLNATWRTDLVEARADSDELSIPSLFVRLWKLHGSVNWIRGHDGQVCRLGYPAEKGRAAAIYPSDAKYEESRRVPFLVLQDRLRRASHVPETLMMITGYSFSDSHLNELIFDAAARCERSEFVAFCYGDVPAELLERATTTPNLQVVGRSSAVLGGVSREWQSPDDPPSDLWDENGFALCDFRHLAGYLARSSARDYDRNDTLVQETPSGSSPSSTSASPDG